MNHTDARRTVEEAITAIVPDADFADLDPQAPLRDVFELDSLDFLGFVESLSGARGAPVPERDYPRLRSLSSCLDYLAEPAHH